MGKKVAIRVFLAIVLLVVLYEIWPLPFWYFATRAILPAGEKISDGFKFVASPFLFLARISNLDRQNKSLEEQNKELTAQVARMAENEHLCLSVSAEANYSKLSPDNSIVAKIVGRTPQSFNQTIIVSAGSRDQIKEGAAVLSSGYLIGRVNRVDQTQSEVHLIFSHDSLVPAILETGRQTGLVQGGLEGLTLTEIPSNTQIKAHDRVLTSGLGGDLPSGLIIGEAEGSLTEKNNLFQSAKVISPIQISQLEVVTIIK